MKRQNLAAAFLVAIFAAAYTAHRIGLADLRHMIVIAEAQTSPDVSKDVLYYRDPDGRPVYSAEPRVTEDGRAFVAVKEGEDVGFDEKIGAPVEPGAREASAEREPKNSGRILYYRNPMGLPDTSPTPKKDSMGMDYIPVFKGEDDGSTVTIGPGKRQRSGVRTEMVGRRNVSEPVRASGVIQIDERRISVVAVRSPSFVNRVEGITTGDSVRKGQVLMRLYSPEVAAAAAQYLSILGQSATSGRSVADGARQRLENLDVPEDVITEVERTKKAPLDFAWPSPRDGVVLSRRAIEGMQAMPGEEMFRVADLSVVWAVIEVAEGALPSVARGQAVTIRARGAADAHTGRVALIYPEINPATRTARLRVELDNPRGVLRPEMYVDAEIETNSSGPVIAAPSSAVIDSGDRRVVLVAKGDDQFEPRDVEIGRRGSDHVEIVSGLAEGDQVVVSANFLIDSESNLKAALSTMSTAEERK